MIKYEEGHCILLGNTRYIVLNTKEYEVLLTHISDPTGRKSRWVLTSLLPVPYAKINLNT